MRRYVDAGPTPGAAMSIVTSKGPVWSEGFGHRDLAACMLIEKSPKHRLLNKWPFDQIAAHLKELGRKQEAKEVRAKKRNLHSERK